MAAEPGGSFAPIAIVGQACLLPGAATPEELAAFRAWFEQFEAAQFDERIVRDVSAGRLDAIAEDAVAAHRAGRSREL